MYLCVFVWPCEHLHYCSILEGLGSGPHYLSSALFFLPLTSLLLFSPSPSLLAPSLSCVVPRRLLRSPGAATSSSGLGTGAIVGILIVVFFLLLVGVDVTCYFLNKCGLLMCIAVNFCGKAGPGAKAKDIEEGKAQFT